MNSLIFVASCFTTLVAGACVADYPDRLLADSLILKHPAVVAAFDEVGRNLSSLYINTTRDGLSFAVVSARMLAPRRLLTLYVGARLYAWHSLYLQ